MIEDVGELKHQHGAKVFANADLLVQGYVQIPGGQSPNDTRAALVDILAQDRTPGLRIGRPGIRKTDSDLVGSRTGAIAP